MAQRLNNKERAVLNDIVDYGVGIDSVVAGLYAGERYGYVWGREFRFNHPAGPIKSLAAKGYLVQIADTMFVVTYVLGDIGKTFVRNGREAKHKT